MEILKRDVVCKRFRVVFVWFLSMVVLLGTGQALPVSGADRKIEFNISQVEAVFIYNLLHFVEWPPEKNQGDIFIAVFGDRRIAENLGFLVDGDGPQARRIKVVRCRKVGDIKNCHILFVGASKLRDMPAIHRHVGNRPILLVGDCDGFLVAGGMVKLVRHTNRISLEINLAAARKAGLNFNSRLLRLARVVSLSP